MSKHTHVVPSGDSKESPTYNRYRIKTNFQPKAINKVSPYLADPRIVHRVREYLEENKDKYYIDFFDMVDQLRMRYKEYRRRKRSDFKALVEKAFSLVLESYERKGDNVVGDDSSSEISDMEMATERALEDSNVANEQMVHLYSKGDDTRNKQCPSCAEEEKVINLSSDEEEVEVSEDPSAKRFKHNNISATPVNVITSVSQAQLPIVNDDVTVTVRPSILKSPVPNDNGIEKKKSVKHVKIVTQPAATTPTVTPGPTPGSTPGSTSGSTSGSTPGSTPSLASKADPASTRLNQSSRKRTRNTQGSAVNGDWKKDLAKQQTHGTDLPIRTPTHTFQDIGGCTKVLQEVCKLLVHIRHPEIYAQVGVSPPRGFLLHGPPGCGKTLLAGAIAGELKIPLLKVSGPELIAGVSGESEKRIRNLFDQAVSIAPCVLFLDEVDAICPNRSTAQREMERRIVAQLLSCLDDLGERENGNRVLVVGATNRPDSLDPALRRAGRFDREVCLGIPDRVARAKILKVVCKNLSLDPEVASDAGMDYLASLTPGFVGADLKALTREAAMVAINRIFNHLQKGGPEEVEMIEDARETTESAEDIEEKVMDVEGEEQMEELEEPVPPAEAPDKSVVIEVNEVNGVDVGIREEDFVIVEEADVSVEETVLDGDTVVDAVTEEPVVIGESPANGKPVGEEDIEVVTTEVVDLELTEESLSSQVSEDPRMTITVVTPDGESQTIVPQSGRAENADQAQVNPEVIAETPQVVIISEDETPLVAEVIASEVIEQVPEIVPPEEPLPEVVSGEVPPHIAAEAAPEMVSEVSIPQTETVPLVAPHDAKVTDDAVMVVEEVDGMGLCQQVTGSPDNSTDLNELLSWLRDSPPLSAEQLNGLNVNLDDFREALQHVQPSAKREGFATVPDVTWDDVGSLGSVRAELQLAVLAPVRYPDQFERLGITSPTGVLLFGPPGCGKTLLAKAIANEAGVNFISVKGPELLNMYVGESERAVRQVFQRARSSAPCVIFFDELDSLCPKRSDSSEGNVSSRVVNQLLTEMDGVESRTAVFLMAATNRPDILDPAVLRPGRLDKVLYVGLPKAADRYDILRALTKDGTKPVLAPDVDLSLIAQHVACEGYSGADLAALVREAGVQALKDFVTSPVEKQDGAQLAVAAKHFAAAIVKIRPSVSDKDQKQYELLRKVYSSAAQRTEDTMDTT